MSTPLVYVDQSVLGLLAQRVPGLASGPKVQWVYSKEHFAEMRRSSNPDQYLTALDKLDAKLIDLELIDWKISGSAKLFDGPTAFQHYSNYCEASADVDVNQNLLNPFQAWVNGGGEEQLLRDLPGHVAEQILALTEDLPTEQRSALRDAASEVDLTPMIGQMIAWGNDIHKTREAIGDGKGRVGQIAGDNQLLQVWALIGPACGGVYARPVFWIRPNRQAGI